MQNFNLISVTTLFTNRSENIKRYFADIQKFKVRNDERLQEFIVKAAMGDLAAENTLIHNYLRIVVSVAKHYEHSSSLALEDLISEGNIGLIKAVRSYDCMSGNSLTTWAVVRIRAAILDAVNTLGRAVYIPIKNEDAKNSYFCTSADAPIGTDEDGDELSFIDTLVSDLDANLDVEEADRRLAIRFAMRKLGETDRKIITLAFGLDGGLPMTNEDVADRVGMSIEGVRKAKMRILRDLHKTFSAQNF